MPQGQAPYHSSGSISSSSSGGFGSYAADLFSSNNFWSGVGGAVSDLFAAQGSKLAGQQYGMAAAASEQAARDTELSTGIQLVQADRNILQTIGGERADTAGAGFSMSGSAGDLLRMSASNGALTKQLISEQGNMTAAGYRSQEQSYQTQQSGAKTEQWGNLIGAGLNVVASFL